MKILLWKDSSTSFHHQQWHRRNISSFENEKFSSSKMLLLYVVAEDIRLNSGVPRELQVASFEVKEKSEQRSSNSLETFGALTLTWRFTYAHGMLLNDGSKLYYIHLVSTTLGDCRKATKAIKTFCLKLLSFQLKDLCSSCWKLVSIPPCM